MIRTRPVLLIVAALGVAAGACRRDAAPPPAASQAPAAPEAPPASPASPAHAAGREHLRAGRLAEAAQMLLEASRTHPDSAPLHRDLGAVFARGRDFGRAAAATSEALRLDPGDAASWIQLGSLRYSAGDPARAQEAFERAVTLAPERADAHDWLGSALFAQHVAALGGDNVDRAKVQAGIAAFTRAIALEPSQPDYRLRCGLARRKARDLEGAQADLREAVRLGGRPECRMHLAETLLERGELAEAERELEAVLRLAPDLARARVAMGRLKLAQGDAAGALAHLQRAVEIEPAAPESRYVLAQVLRRLGNDDSAAREEAEYGRLHRETESKRALTQAIASQPANAQAHQALGQLREASGDLQGAAEAYGRAIEIDPRFVAARVNLGGLLLDAGRADAALPHLRAAAAADPKVPEIHVNLGLAHERLGDRASAASAYAEALRLSPGDASIARQFARVSPGVVVSSR